MTTETRLVLVDDHTLVRDGLRTILEAQGFTVVGEAADGATGVNTVERMRPDIALVDVNMPGPGPVEIVTELRRRVPTVKVVILSMHAPEALVAELQEAGAAGYFLKHIGRRSLAAGLHAVLESDDMISLIPSRTNPEREAELRLTAKETEVLQLLGKSYTNSRIAEELYISEATVKRHLTTIYSKLGVGSRVEALVKATQEGLIGGLS